MEQKKRKWENPYKSKILKFNNFIFQIEKKEEAKEAINTLKALKTPIIVEVGSGSGNHLIELAKRNQKKIVVGIELRYKRAFRTIEKALENNISNIRVLRAKVQALSPYIKSNLKIDSCYINFPDPWPKKRNKKNRILTNGLISEISSWLTKDGILSVKTDKEDYFFNFLKEIENHTIWETLFKTNDLYKGNQKILENNIKSEFEELFFTKNIPIHHIVLKKI